ncbi:hypothetical protein BH11BAC6_BH11BAC6_09090 [soil metagenome]
MKHVAPVAELCTAVQVSDTTKHHNFTNACFINFLKGKNPGPKLVQGSFAPNLNRVYIDALSRNVVARSCTFMLMTFFTLGVSTVTFTSLFSCISFAG